MRLVDADTIRKQFDPDTWQGELMIAITDNLPTAYDVDKVVEQLEACGKKMSESKLPHHYYRAISVNKAVQIVENGGVNDKDCK